MKSSTSAIESVQARAFRIATDLPEGDGTLEWNSTTLVIVLVRAGGMTGLGYTYASRAAATFVEEKLGETVRGLDALDPPRAFEAMTRALRNAGVPGAGLMAISAVDIALYDLKAKLLNTSLVKLLGRARDSVPAYGSGGFTTYPLETLQKQLSGWVDQGLQSVKMKIGLRDPLRRVRAAREAVGNASLMVDANGAYQVKEALHYAEQFPDVTWFEEPVSSDDLEGLALLRSRAPAGMRIAAGEYGDTQFYFRRMLGSVDVLQADATRCGGVTGFLRASSLAHSFSTPFSAHCAPALHALLGVCADTIESVEYFHDHVRIESRAFDGLPKLIDGALHPDPNVLGHGLILKERDLAS